MSLGPEDILELLPHRYPFILVDRIREIKSDEYAIGVKNVSLNEPFFQGHFPYYRVMPGVLIVEAMAQVAGVLVGYSEPQAVNDSRVPLLAGVDHCRFRRQVVPGDQLVLRLEVVRRHGSVWRVAGRACVDGQLSAESQLLVFLGDRPEAEEAR